jgi:hypothetical protein
VQNAFEVLSDYFGDILEILAQRECNLVLKKQPTIDQDSHVDRKGSLFFFYEVWYVENVFECQCDILCVVEYKDHTKSRSFIQHNGYYVYYTGVNGGVLYLSVILIVKDTL